MSTTPKPRVPLESGDRLTREEYHRRYCLRPDIRKAELVNGVVYIVEFPVSDQHSAPHGIAVTWLGVYAARTPGVQMRDNGTVFLTPESEVQPDVFLFRDPSPPGGARLTAAGYIEGAPQFVLEVSASSASRDLHDKLEDYQRAGVLEYVVWLTYEQRVAWFRLTNGRFVPVQPDERGVIESTAFPGLRLNVSKLLAGDFAGVLAELDLR
jgi:Uma2 family endonuclease